MTLKLIQRHILYGKQEFELGEDSINVKIKSLLRGNKELDITLAIINPDPVITKSRLDFHSRVKCRPLISLYLNKPNPKEFNTFVNALISKAKKEFNDFAGLQT